MDGLLLDTETIALAAFHDTCEHFGVEDETKLFERCIGTYAARSEQTLREGLGGEFDHLSFACMWDAKYIQRTLNAPIPLKDGAAELLACLAELEIPVAVATSTESRRAMRKLEAVGILTHFKAIVGGDQVRNSKPHPDIYLRAAQILGVRPTKCLALEDSENGVRSAADAVTVIQIPDIVQPSTALRSLGHTILQSLHDVRTYEFQETEPPQL